MHLKYHSSAMKFINKSILVLYCWVALAGAHPLMDANIVESTDIVVSPTTCRMGDDQLGNCTPSFQSCLADQNVSNLRHCNLINNGDHFMIGIGCTTSDVVTLTTDRKPESCGTSMEVTTTTGTTNSLRPVTDASIILTAGSPSSVICGVGPNDTIRSIEDSKIIGGKPAVPNSWPFMVAIFWNGLFNCGGSLLDAYHILTAAHCIYKPHTLLLIEKDHLEVVLGMHSKSDKNVVRRQVRMITPHKYDQISITNDIAILRMNKPVTFSEKISPICLPAAVDLADRYVDKDAVVLGWGRTFKGHRVKLGVLKQATLKVISNFQCDEAVNSEDLLATSEGREIKIVDHMLCAISSGQSSCYGDSGGPLVMKTASGAWVQAGIVSWGRGCAEPIPPSVYTRVNSFTDWIAKNMHL